MSIHSEHFNLKETRKYTYKTGCDHNHFEKVHGRLYSVGQIIKVSTTTKIHIGKFHLNKPPKKPHKIFIVPRTKTSCAVSEEISRAVFLIARFMLKCEEFIVIFLSCYKGSRMSFTCNY